MKVSLSNKREQQVMSSERLKHGVSPIGKVDGRLPGKGNLNSHGVRPVHLIITMLKWIWTSELSIKHSLSESRARGTGCEQRVRETGCEPRARETGCGAQDDAARLARVVPGALRRL